MPDLSVDLYTYIQVEEREKVRSLRVVIRSETSDVWDVYGLPRLFSLMDWPLCPSSFCQAARFAPIWSRFVWWMTNKLRP